MGENQPKSPLDYCDIKHLLCKKGYTVTRVAMELGLAGPQSIQQVCTRKYSSARIEKFISELIEQPLHVLFPDRYSKS